MRHAIILSAALLAATTAQAGYYNTIPDGHGGYTYAQPSGPDPYQQQLQRQLYMQQQEIENLRAAQPHCVNRAMDNGQLYTYCK